MIIKELKTLAEAKRFVASLKDAYPKPRKSSIIAAKAIYAGMSTALGLKTIGMTVSIAATSMLTYMYFKASEVGLIGELPQKLQYLYGALGITAGTFLEIATIGTGVLLYRLVTGELGDDAPVHKRLVPAAMMFGAFAMVAYIQATSFGHGAARIIASGIVPATQYEKQIKAENEAALVAERLADKYVRLESAIIDGKVKPDPSMFAESNSEVTSLLKSNLIVAEQTLKKAQNDFARYKKIEIAKAVNHKGGKLSAPLTSFAKRSIAAKRAEVEKAKAAVSAIKAQIASAKPKELSKAEYIARIESLITNYKAEAAKHRAKAEVIIEAYTEKFLAKVRKYTSTAIVAGWALLIFIIGADAVFGFLTKQLYARIEKEERNRERRAARLAGIDEEDDEIVLDLVGDDNDVQQMQSDEVALDDVEPVEETVDTADEIDEFVCEGNYKLRSRDDVAAVLVAKGIASEDVDDAILLLEALVERNRGERDFLLRDVHKELPISYHTYRNLRPLLVEADIISIGDARKESKVCISRAILDEA